MNDPGATSFTPLYAINHRGVQLFAAPYAKSVPINGDVEPAPAAADKSETGEWTGQDAMNYSVRHVSTLPLLM